MKRNVEEEVRQWLNKNRYSNTRMLEKMATDNGLEVGQLVSFIRRYAEAEDWQMSVVPALCDELKRFWRAVDGFWRRPGDLFKEVSK